jgi:undecaprenyl-diphosphatase
VLWYFRREWLALLAAAWRVVMRRSISGSLVGAHEPEAAQAREVGVPRPPARSRAVDEQAHERRVLYLVIATVPGAVGGKLLEQQAETVFRSVPLVAASLIVLGVLLWLVDRVVPRVKPLEAMRWPHAVAFGVAQVFALVPGVSRSGSTITAGRMMGFTREAAAVFSFLMSMPIIAGAALLKVPEALRERGLDAPLVVGVVAAAVSGWVAIAVLLRYVARHSYGIFALYRLALGVAALALYAARG